MSDRNQLYEAIDQILELVSRDSLRTLFFQPIETTEYEEFLARLSCHVAPSYLPFATDDSGILVAHLQPDRELINSPILYVPDDDQTARFMCDSFASFPSAIWLWVCTYFKTEPDTLRQATEEMVSKIPNAQPLSERLWSFLDQDPVRWSAKSDAANQAWSIANVGHPFAGMPRISIITKPQEALALLEEFLYERIDIPEVLSVLLAIRVKLDLPNQPSDILKILLAEAWRDIGGYLTGRWRCNGRGISEWDSTLISLNNRNEVFKDTPFEILSNFPNTYSGEDKNGSYRLLNVAREFEKSGQRKEELCQLRNTATLSLLTLGEYSPELCHTIANCCEAISINSLAAVVARESAKVHNQGP